MDMNSYRVTIRHGHPHRYHVEDVAAASLRAAVRIAAERFPEQADASADLVEIRLQREPERREYSPG